MQVQQVMGFAKVYVESTRVLCTSQLVSMVTAIWQSLETQCECTCTEYSISALEFSAWCDISSMLHICGNVR